MLASITGKVMVMAKLAIHCALAATARAAPRIRLLNISPNNTHTTGPQLKPKNTTNKLAIISANVPMLSLRASLPASSRPALPNI